MSTDTVSVFLALLALIALAGAAAVTLTATLARRTGPDSGLARLHRDAAALALPLAWTVAVTATAGSLYYSEVAHFTPCRLCWYQRIAMYPLAVVLGIATFTRDASVRRYAIPPAAIGAVIAVYHSWLQAFPDQTSTFCTLDAPCTQRHVWELGFVSIPFMALCGFVAIIALLAVASPTGAATSASAAASGRRTDETRPT